ncbi:type II toxin-antitoxin system RelE family toxin [Streptomonospora litoralis]|uniref:Plasmid stabilization system protein n=1 Tax=Streptomonospora litoralis TaxID=2498135 RepID=A0A4P6Q8Y8_9ACTN|nr:type II toxin-antitoxin system RelE/ParE family toxin [Streptomonospora litoralis]QBI56021.1 Plasmid stabilization system protein [Streptomonospora litoralis]
MSRYTIEISVSARKMLRKLDVPVRKRVVAAIADLADNPRPDGCKKLQGRSEYRVRVGDYRVLYDINDSRIRVEVVAVGHRREIYGR